MNMFATNLKTSLIGLVMLLAAGLSLALTPRERAADHRPAIDLEAMIPKHFGDWQMEDRLDRLMVNPEVQAKIDRIYNQTITRTYVNSHNERIMLSIAYGSEQSDSMAVHRPEYCYPAQGFQILKNEKDIFSTGEGKIPVKRLLAKQGARVEPITYWTTIGDTVAIKGLQWKIYQIKYGLTGEIPDGLLYRISSIQPDESAAYRMQDDFSRSLLGALSQEGKVRIIGHPPSDI